MTRKRKFLEFKSPKYRTILILGILENMTSFLTFFVKAILFKIIRSSGWNGALRSFIDHRILCLIFQVANGVDKDLRKCWRFLLLFIVTALVACLFTILIMGVVTRIFVWIALWMILILLCAGKI